MQDEAREQNKKDDCEATINHKDVAANEDKGDYGLRNPGAVSGFQKVEL